METGKPVVLVLMNGRPLALSWENEFVPVIVEAWHPGIQAGNAVARVLSGAVNPEGKLSSSFPALTGMCPVYYNHMNTGRPGSKSKFTSRYLDAPLDSLYPFGFGLSYTSYEYTDLKVEEDGDVLNIRVDVANTGGRDGRETVQLYTQDVAASLVRPVKELKRFEKVALAAGEKKSVQFTLPKAELGFFDNDGKYLLEDGLFRIYAGGSSRECLSEEIRLAF